MESKESEDLKVEGTSVVDLVKEDCPHPTAEIEWWHFNAHLATVSGRPLSIFCSFFRIVENTDTPPRHAHSTAWALVVPDAEQTKDKFVFQCSLDHDAVAIIQQRSGEVKQKMDPRLARALDEVLNKGAVPLPDTVFARAGVAESNTLCLDYSPHHRLRKDDTVYVVSCGDLNLRFKPLKRAFRQQEEKSSEDGCVMFKYSIPRCEVTGSVVVDGKKQEVQGQGWYDHEFGGHAKPSVRCLQQHFLPSDKWCRLVAQLANNCEVTVTVPFLKDTRAQTARAAVVVRSDGREVVSTKALFQPRVHWTSCRTAIPFETRWTLVVPEAELEMDVCASLAEQEMISVIAQPSFWTGRVALEGRMGEEKVTGLGFVEQHGFGDMRSMGLFFKRISKLVRVQVDKVLPLHSGREAVEQLVCDGDHLHLMQGLDPQKYIDTVVRPIRSIIDRGGKSWRSYALCLCIDAIGGFSEVFRPWLAMPEIMHVGSLIVDDIQDESETRRGGPACHMMYGVPLAINAGTAAYFVCVNLLQRLTPALDPRDRLRIYELYFLALRAGHAGQAFDIHVPCPVLWLVSCEQGVDELMEEAVRSGETARLEESVLCTHRLKSAVPAGALAQMGAIIGGATPEAEKAIASFFEALGVAFQIVDDVLNLCGFAGQGKTRGEDIMAGKVTYPIALAMSKTRLSKDEREVLWAIVRSKTSDEKTVQRAIDIVERCGGNKEAREQASALVETAWKKLDTVIPDSYFKLNLRAFSWFVLERQY